MSALPKNPIDAIKALDQHLPEWEQTRNTSHMSGVERLIVKAAFQVLSTIAQSALDAAIKGARAAIEHKKEVKKDRGLGGDAAERPVPPVTTIAEPPILPDSQEIKPEKQE